jgi:hypothetical protein
MRRVHFPETGKMFGGKRMGKENNQYAVQCDMCDMFTCVTTQPEDDDTPVCCPMCGSDAEITFLEDRNDDPI